MKKFFIGCNLDFETELAKELQEIWPFLQGLDGKTHAEPLNIVEQFSGGLMIENSWHLGLQVNFFSKLANRVLLRLSEFRVRDFPKFFQKAKDLQQHPLLRSRSFQFEVACSQSRLNNEKRILEILNELFPTPAKEVATDTLFVRLHDDNCTISIDTSGTHLHKRSQRLQAGDAPLRETLAAFCGRKLIEDLHFTDLQDLSLVDPMAGTATLLLETCLLYQATVRADFPFLQWKQTPKILLSPSLMKGYASFPRLFHQVIAQDRDGEVLELARARLRASGLAFQCEPQDLLKRDLPVKKIRCFVVLNPPYGERLRADFEPLELLQKIEAVYGPERLGVLFSEAQMRSIRGKTPAPFQLRSESRFKNGGLTVHFLVFERQTSLA